MKSRHRRWEDEYREHLRINAAPDLPFRHSDLLHDLEPGLILISFCDLLVIHDQDHRQNKDAAQDDTKCKQSTERTKKVAAVIRNAFRRVCDIYIHPFFADRQRNSFLNLDLLFIAAVDIESKISPDVCCIVTVDLFFFLFDLIHRIHIRHDHKISRIDLIRCHLIVKWLRHCLLHLPRIQIPDLQGLIRIFLPAIDADQDLSF